VPCATGRLLVAGCGQGAVRASVFPGNIAREHGFPVRWGAWPSGCAMAGAGWPVWVNRRLSAGRASKRAWDSVADPRRPRVQWPGGMLLVRSVAASPARLRGPAVVPGSEHGPQARALLEPESLRGMQDTGRLPRRPPAEGGRVDAHFGHARRVSGKSGMRQRRGRDSDGAEEGERRARPRCCLGLAMARRMGPARVCLGPCRCCAPCLADPNGLRYAIGGVSR
jgi:hypothetical protein